MILRNLYIFRLLMGKKWEANYVPHNCLSSFDNFTIFLVTLYAICLFFPYNFRFNCTLMCNGRKQIKTIDLNKIQLEK